jgi:hypothetical protein
MAQVPLGSVTVSVAATTVQPVDELALKTYPPVPFPPDAVVVVGWPKVAALGPVTLTVPCEALLSATVKGALSALSR